jgi:penicillin-binding protein 2
MTPLQLAVMGARMVNGGKRVLPKIFLDERVEYEEPESMGINPEHLKIVVQGMDDVYNHQRGTAFAHRARGKDYKIGGKTGTTQVVRISMAQRQEGLRDIEDIEWIQRDHALFIGYGPVEAPKYSVAVLVEHGGGGSSVASPIARDVLEFLLDRDLAAEEASRPGQEV